MKAKILVYLLPALILATIHLAGAQQDKVYRVGILSLGESSPLNGFRNGLKDAGYVEGKNLILDISVKQNYGELRPIAKVYVEKWERPKIACDVRPSQKISSKPESSGAEGREHDSRGYLAVRGSADSFGGKEERLKLSKYKQPTSSFLYP